MAMPTCAICLAPLTLRQDLKVTFCGHIYHSNCITEWFGKQRGCPQCRTVIPQQDGVTNLYVNFNLNESFIDVDEQILIQNDYIQAYKIKLERQEKEIRDLMRAAKEKEERHQVFQMEFDECKIAHNQQIADLQKKITEKPAPKNPFTKKRGLNEENKENPPAVKKAPTAKTLQVPSTSSNSTAQESRITPLIFSPVQTRRMRALKSRDSYAFQFYHQL